MACQKQTETLEAFDGIELYCETYACQEPKGVIIALHDLAEHCGLYNPIFERLASENYQVYAMDLRGHGRSPGDRAYIAAFDDFLDDLDIFLARVRDRVGLRSDPIFLLGQGLGATIAARFALTRKPKLNGLVLCGPLLDLPLSRFERTLAQMSGAWFPHATFAPQALHSWLEPRLKEIAKDDPLAFRGPLQLNTVRQILGACADLRGSMQHVPFPVLTLLGLGTDRAQTKLTEQLQDAFLSVDKTLLSYENIGQNVLLHRERDQVVGDLIEWCDRQRSEAASNVSEDQDEDEDIDDSL